VHALENTLGIPHNIKHRVPIWFSNTSQIYISESGKFIFIQKLMHEYLQKHHSKYPNQGYIPNILISILISIILSVLNEQNVIYSSNGILLRYKNQIYNYHMDEPWKHYNAGGVVLEVKSLFNKCES
jgi:hypothetical protein